MPLIFRKNTHKTVTSMSVASGSFRKYVHPTRVRPDDVPVPFEKISDRQLQDLAGRYPDEYEEHCLARGLQPTPIQPRTNTNAKAVEIDEALPLEEPAGKPRRSEPLEDPDAQQPNVKPRLVATKAPTIDPNASLDDDEGDDEPDASEGKGEGSAVIDELEQTFVAMKVADACDFIEQVAAQGRTRVLVRLHAAEKGQTKPRVSVLKKLAEKGVTEAAQ